MNFKIIPVTLMCFFLTTLSYGGKNGLQVSKKNQSSTLLSKVTMMSLIANTATFLSLEPVLGGHISLPNPGICDTQTGFAKTLPSCLSNSANFTVDGACCIPNSGMTLVINASRFDAPEGDCCKRCTGRGDVNTEDSEDNKFSLGPCLAKDESNCKRLKSLCDPDLCKWTNDMPSPCKYVKPSPQVNLLTVQSANYGVNFTFGENNNVVSMTPYLLTSNEALGMLSAFNCKSFKSLLQRSGFSAHKSSAQNGIITWTIEDQQSSSELKIECRPAGTLFYNATVHTGVESDGYCINSEIKDAVVSEWKHNYTSCYGVPLPPSLHQNASYIVQIVTTPWADLKSDLPPCTAGWLISWYSGSKVEQVAIPVGTIVEDVPNQNQEPGLYDGQQTVKYISPDYTCGCAPQPGSKLYLQYKGNKSDTCLN